MPTQRLIHLNVVCSDLDRSLAFYQDVVGAKVANRFESDGSDFLGAMGISGGSDYRAAMLYIGDEKRGPYIDLLEWTVKGKDGALEVRDLGIPRIALVVDDVDTSYDAVKAKGVVPMGEPTDVGTGEYKLRCFIFPDPDGVLIEFVQSIRA
jgi:catechol 2,3-dioxygenase-like lactoylglutathione lyase family enzyme